MDKDFFIGDGMKKKDGKKKPEWLKKIGQHQKDVFDEILEYVQSLIYEVLKDAHFIDMEFRKDVASLKNLEAKRTKFQRELELDVMEFCQTLMEKSDEFKRESKTEEEYKIFLEEGNKILLDEAKEFIRTRFKVEAGYALPEQLIRKNDELVKAVKIKLTEDIKDFATKNEFPKNKTVSWKNIELLLSYLKEQHSGEEINKDSVARILRRLDYSTPRDPYLKD